MIEVQKTSYGKKLYFIKLRQLHLDMHIAKYLNLTLQEYQLILRKHKAYKSKNGDYYFKYKPHARLAAKELNLYLTMAKLLRS